MDVPQRDLERRLDEILGLDRVEGDGPRGCKEHRSFALEGGPERHRVDGADPVRRRGLDRSVALNGEIGDPSMRQGDSDHTFQEAARGAIG
jgi:hypothetical protein